MMPSVRTMEMLSLLMKKLSLSHLTSDLMRGEGCRTDFSLSEILNQSFSPRYLSSPTVANKERTLYTSTVSCIAIVGSTSLLIQRGREYKQTTIPASPLHLVAPGTCTFRFSHYFRPLRKSLRSKTSKTYKNPNQNRWIYAPR